MDSEKLKLLKSLRLLDQIPEKHLAALEKFLKSRELKDKEIIFEEGNPGDSLYFVSSGHVRISKRFSAKAAKDLAILGPGDCFGEMAVLAPAARSAQAAADGSAVVFELARKDLNSWLKDHPELALGFFAGLVQAQSQRLRQTSRELTLLFDLSNLFLESLPSSKELLSRAIDHILPHLEGVWSASAQLHNLFNDEMELVASRGGFDFASISGRVPAATETRNLWIDDQTYYASLPGEKRPHGFLLLHSGSKLSEEARNETGRTLTTAAQLLAAALENANYRQEEILRARLKSAHSYGPGI